MIHLRKSKIEYPVPAHTMPNANQLGPTLNKREIKKIDWNVVKRLVVILWYNSGMKKTNIALKCSMGYDKCVLYLDWLEMMDLIKRKSDENGFETVILSEKGNDFYKKIKCA